MQKGSLNMLAVMGAIAMYPLTPLTFEWTVMIILLNMMAVLVDHVQDA